AAPVGGGRKRRARRRELERAYDAPAVVRMYACCGRRVALGEERVRALRAQLVVDALPALALARSGRRRQLEVGERRAQIEPRAADDDRRPPGRHDLVDRLMGAALVA